MKKLLYFTSPTCAKCKIVETWIDEFVASQAEKTPFTYEKINTSLTLDAARKYRVSSLPGFVVVGEDGFSVGKICGIPEKGAVSAYVAALL